MKQIGGFQKRVRAVGKLTVTGKQRGRCGCAAVVRIVVKLIKYRETLIYVTSVL
jgi:hypothetical protein